MGKATNQELTKNEYRRITYDNGDKVEEICEVNDELLAEIKSVVKQEYQLGKHNAELELTYEQTKFYTSATKVMEGINLIFAGTVIALVVYGGITVWNWIF